MELEWKKTRELTLVPVAYGVGWFSIWLVWLVAFDLILRVCWDSFYIWFGFNLPCLLSFLLLMLDQWLLSCGSSCLGAMLPLILRYKNSLYYGSSCLLPSFHHQGDEVSYHHTQWWWFTPSTINDNDGTLLWLVTCDLTWLVMLLDLTWLDLACDVARLVMLMMRDETCDVRWGLWC